ncbi:MAG: KTSC domain-containing protein [Candidatus Omnitrophota bacterium]
MKRTRVDSTMLASVGYEPDTLTLEVEFKDHNGTEPGPVYRYVEVPKTVYRKLMRANSKGQFMNAHIINHYKYLKVD